jgi:hypothetical protein
MRAQFVPQGAGQNLLALTQDEITAQGHHHAHSNGQEQNQSGAQAHTTPFRESGASADFPSRRDLMELSIFLSKYPAIWMMPVL